jgi:hypothetical protein
MRMMTGCENQRRRGSNRQEQEIRIMLEKPWWRGHARNRPVFFRASGLFKQAGATATPWL